MDSKAFYHVTSYKLDQHCLLLVYSRLVLAMVLCPQCGRGPDGLRACSFCLAVSYCSRPCQKDHWILSHCISCFAMITLSDCGGDSWQMSYRRNESVGSMIKRIRKERNYSKNATLNLILRDELLPEHAKCWRTGLGTGCTVYVTVETQFDSDGDSMPRLMTSDSESAF